MLSRDCRGYIAIALLLEFQQQQRSTAHRRDTKASMYAGVSNHAAHAAVAQRVAEQIGIASNWTGPA
jgi:hypothetical protein